MKKKPRSYYGDMTSVKVKDGRGIHILMVEEYVKHHINALDSKINHQMDSSFVNLRKDMIAALKKIRFELGLKSKKEDFCRDEKNGKKAKGLVK